MNCAFELLIYSILDPLGRGNMLYSILFLTFSLTSCQWDISVQREFSRPLAMCHSEVFQLFIIQLDITLLSTYQYSKSYRHDKYGQWSIVSLFLFICWISRSEILNKAVQTHLIADKDTTDNTNDLWNSEKISSVWWSWWRCVCYWRRDGDSPG